MDFGTKYPDAAVPLQAWRKLIESDEFPNFASLKTALNTTDKVGNFHVFDIGGNKYRLIAAIHFNRQMLFVRHVLSHDQYDKWKP